jgi:D-alanyl-D-alanine carboxypeptidase/D-alanyl-D-alanine-endopeptidase (penicillin-binding protein 4)
MLLAALLCCAFGAIGQTTPSDAQQAPVTGATSSLAAEMDALLATPAAMRAHWGISVVDAGTGAVLYARNEAQLFEPASNAKLFTTAAALALLGPSYTMQTRVVAEGTVSPDGKLHGVLKLMGGGDPTLSGRAYPYAGRTERAEPPLHALDELAAQVAAAGIRAVDAIDADDSNFRYERYGTGWAWDDLQWEYGAAVSALTVNDNVRYLTIMPGARAGDPVTLTWDPPDPVAPETGGCAATCAQASDPHDPTTLLATTAAAGSEAHLGLSREVDGGPLLIYGTLPAGGKPVNAAIAMRDPAGFAADAFAAALGRHGVQVGSGRQASHRPPTDMVSFAVESRLPVNLQAPGPVFPSVMQGRLVATRVSPPLAQIVTVVNKVSQNLHAEMLLRLLGETEGGNGSSVVEGVRVVRQFLVSAGIDPLDFSFVDGSGLSPQDLITPRATTTLLVYAARQSWGGDYRASLPVGGVDGSLASRFKQPALLGRVAAKTGSLTGVNTLSGYLTAASGRQLAFSILANDYVGEGSRATIDSVVAAVAAAF